MRNTKNEDAGNVFCSYTRMVDISELKPNPRNPNTHPDEQVKLLANIIAKAGWRSPIVVSKRSGYITKGHGRLAAAKLIGAKSVPVDEQDYPDESSEMADMVADNRIAELSEFDRATLKDILQDLDTGAFDMLMTGFDNAAIEALMTALPPDVPIEPLARVDVAGDVSDAGRVIILYGTDEEKNFIEEKLGVKLTKVVYTTQELVQNG